MLKKVLALGLILLAVLLPSVASAQNTQNFYISHFDASYYLSRDANKTSQLKVEEAIVAQFPNYDQNHGILRAIPETFDGHTTSLQINSVTDIDNQPINYTTYSESGNLVLKIGDADKYVHGSQLYKISYQMKNVISFHDIDEFYWDVNGDQWSQSFGSVIGRVFVADELGAELTGDKVCYVGKFGAQGTNCQVETKTIEGNDYFEFTASDLDAYQTLTFDIGFAKGTFELGPEVVAAERREKLIIGAIVAAALAPLLISIWFVAHRYRKFGRDPKGKGVIVPEYQPPKGFNSLTGDAVVNEDVSTKALTATIIELAVAGYLVISEVKQKKLLKDTTDFEIELVKDPSDLTSEQQTVVDALFSQGDVVGQKVKLGDLKNKLHQAVADTNDQVLGKMFDDGYFINHPKKTRAKYSKIGTVMMAIGFGIGFAVFTLPFAAGFIVGGLVVLLSAKAMPAKSLKGVEARDQMLGLKMYMQLAEADRIKFLQGVKTAERVETGGTSHAQKLKLFEKLLPYAMLFGIEKDWAKQFEHLYTQPPDWYHGSHLNTFNTVYLASALGDSFNSAVTTSFSAPASSGSSGFGGGGFSGGGGGGGGGGGW